MYMSIWFHVSSVRSRVSSWLMSLDGEIFFVAMCRFPEIESVYLNMPNIHFLPVNMPTVGVKVDICQWQPEVLYLVYCIISKSSAIYSFSHVRQVFEIWLSAWKAYLCFHMFPCSVWRWCFHSNRWAPWFYWSTIKQETHPDFQFVKCYQGICDTCLQLRDADILHSMLVYQK